MKSPAGAKNRPGAVPGRGWLTRQREADRERGYLPFFLSERK